MGRILTLVAFMFSAKRRPLSKHHKKKSVGWAKQYMKIDFSEIFSNEDRAILDGPDGNDRIWLLHRNIQPI